MSICKKNISPKVVYALDKVNYKIVPLESQEQKSAAYLTGLNVSITYRDAYSVLQDEIQAELDALTGRLAELRGYRRRLENDHMNFIHSGLTYEQYCKLP